MDIAFQVDGVVMATMTVGITLMKWVVHIMLQPDPPLHLGLVRETAVLMNLHATMASVFTCGMSVMALMTVVTTQMRCTVEQQVLPEVQHHPHLEGHAITGNSLAQMEIV